MKKPRYSKDEELVLERMSIQDKARSNLLTFTLYTKPDYEVNWHHRKVCKVLDKFASGEVKRLMIFMPPRTGKALTVDTPILTANRGWVTMETIRIGDKVFGQNGRPTAVIAKSDVFKNRPVFRVSSDDGASVVADSEHLWTARVCRKRPVFRNWSTQKLADRTSYRRALIPRWLPIQTKPIDLPIPPYTLGIWLGDGSKREAVITMSDEDASEVRPKIEADGFKTSDQATKMTFGVLGLKALLRAHNLLANKHVPKVYLTASVEQRLALLQGLMDSDGYVDERGSSEFCSTSKDLAEAVRFLVHSFGRKASLSEGRSTLYGVDHGPKYRVHFYMAGASSLGRRAANCRDGVKQPGRYLTVEPVGHADTVCIQVAAKNGLFLAGSGLLLTHNSELVSRRLPAYLLGRDPNVRLITASYSASLATSMSRDVQRIIDGKEYRELFPKTKLKSFTGSREDDPSLSVRKSDLFEVVGHRGAYRAAGVGGGITGTGADRILIDDPIKNQEEADSIIQREAVYNWYTSTLYTRMEKDASILLTLTRWHEDDLAGRLLREAAEDPEADQWTVISYPMEAEGEPTVYDPRQPGEALWPNKYPQNRLTAMRKTVGTRVWTALYQQRPSPVDGNIVQDHWWRYYDDPPKFFDTIIQSWDLTFKETVGTDYVVGVVLGRRKAEIYVLDLVRARMSFTENLKAFRKLSAKWPTAHIKLVEEKANGSALIDSLKSEIQGIIAVQPDGSKIGRANAATPVIEANNVFLPNNCPWSKQVVAEWRSFPNGTHDDIVDAMSQGLLRLMKIAKDDFKIISLVGNSTWKY